MRAIAIALVIIVRSTMVFAQSDAFMDPKSAAVTIGRVTIGTDESTANVTVTNLTDRPMAVVAVTCAMLVNGESIETGSSSIESVAPHGKAYASLNFFEVHGDRSAKADCRVLYVRSKL